MINVAWKIVPMMLGAFTPTRHHESLHVGVFDCPDCKCRLLLRPGDIENLRTLDHQMECSPALVAA